MSQFYGSDASGQAIETSEATIQGINDSLGAVSLGQPQKLSVSMLASTGTGGGHASGTLSPLELLD